jgi:2-hydroxy-6-oxonona-2,4-dienedioate hydrolase
VTLTQADAARTVQTKDWKLRYYEAGQGTPVILLHGSGPGATGWSNFSGNIEALAESFHVYAVDMPGWGESDPITVDTLDHVETAVQFMAAFVGNSMGGHTSIRMAIEKPERVSHLITMGAPIQMGPFLFGAGGGPSEGLKIMYQGYSDYSPEGMKRLVEIMVYDRERFATPELCQQRSEAVARRPEHVANIAASAGKAPISKWVDLNRVSEIAAPALLIHGRDDRVVSFESTLFLAARISNSRAHIINRCGHWAQLEHADEFNHLVTDFVTRY